MKAVQTKKEWLNILVATMNEVETYKADYISEQAVKQVLDKQIGKGNRREIIIARNHNGKPGESLG